MKLSMPFLHLDNSMFLFPLSVIQGPETCLFWTTSAGSLAVEGCAKKGRLLICDFCLDIKSNATCTKTSQVSWRKEKCFKRFMSVSDCWDSETAVLLIDSSFFLLYLTIIILLGHSPPSWGDFTLRSCPVLKSARNRKFTLSFF